MRAVMALALTAAGFRVQPPRPPIPTNLAVGDTVPYLAYREGRCWDIGGPGDFPPRCARIKDHDGNHAAGEMTVLAVWPRLTERTSR